MTVSCVRVACPLMMRYAASAWVSAGEHVRDLEHDDAREAVGDDAADEQEDAPSSRVRTPSTCASAPADGSMCSTAKASATGTMTEPAVETGARREVPREPRSASAPSDSRDLHRAARPPRRSAGTRRPTGWRGRCPRCAAVGRCACSRRLASVDEVDDPLPHLRLDPQVGVGEVRPLAPPPLGEAARDRVGEHARRRPACRPRRRVGRARGRSASHGWRYFLARPPRTGSSPAIVEQPGGVRAGAGGSSRWPG